MASANVTITITDSVNATLADVRDTLCTLWGYAGDPQDNAAKLTFLKAQLANYVKTSYAQGKAQAAEQNTFKQQFTTSLTADII